MICARASTVQQLVVKAYPLACVSRFPAAGSPAASHTGDPMISAVDDRDRRLASSSSIARVEEGAHGGAMSWIEHQFLPPSRICTTRPARAGVIRNANEARRSSAPGEAPRDGTNFPAASVPSASRCAASRQRRASPVASEQWREHATAQSQTVRPRASILPGARQSAMLHPASVRSSAGASKAESPFIVTGKEVPVVHDIPCPDDKDI